MDEIDREHLTVGPSSLAADLKKAVSESLQIGTVQEIRAKPDAAEAQAIIDADKRAREQEMIAIVDRESRRLRCKVFAIAQIVEDRVHTSVQIEAR